MSGVEWAQESRTAMVMDEYFFTIEHVDASTVRAVQPGNTHHAGGAI